MLQNIQGLPRGQRLVIFILIFGGILALLIGVTVFLVVGSINAEPRGTAVALTDTITVAEFAVLPGADAFPAAVAVAPDGRVYTGSYKTGTLWVIGADGQPAEVPGSAEAMGSVAGLSFGADGSLYIVDQKDADPRTSGGQIQRITADGTISPFATIPDERGFIAADDVAVDGSNNVYVTDRGRDEVWRFAPDGTGEVWWTPPALDGVKSYEPTGLAYDAGRQALIITDGLANTVYSVALADQSSTLLYQHGDRPDAPGFDGVTVLPDGTIYVAALEQNGIVRVADGQLTYIAGLFRGASDVDTTPDGTRLYVTNFDSFSLAVPGTFPHLPFGLDVITFVPPT